MSGKMTKVTRTEDKDGTTWAFGHIHASRPTSKNYEIGTIRITHWSDRGNGSLMGNSLPLLSPQEAIHASDVLRAAAGNASAYMCAGKSLHEMLWDELMTIMDRLMTGQEAEDGRDPGRAEGVAYCIAVFQNPYAPNIEGVRAEAMDRWDQQEAAPPPRRAAAVQAGARATRRARRG